MEEEREQAEEEEAHHEDEVVEHLDVIDPEISAGECPFGSDAFYHPTFEQVDEAHAEGELRA